MTPLLDCSSAWYCEIRLCSPMPQQHAGNKIYSTMTSGEG